MAVQPAYNFVPNFQAIAELRVIRRSGARSRRPRGRGRAAGLL